MRPLDLGPSVFRRSGEGRWGTRIQARMRLKAGQIWRMQIRSSHSRSAEGASMCRRVPRSWANRGASSAARARDRFEKSSLLTQDEAPIPGEGEILARLRIDE
jgi:hypothetical protein